MASVTFNLLDMMREDFFDETTVLDLEYAATPANDVLTMMVLNALTIDQNLDDLISSVATFTEVTESNYTAGGNELADCAVTMDGSGLITVDATDPATWSQHATGFPDAVRVVIAMKNAGASSTWDLLGYSDAFTAAGNVAGDFSIALAAGGIFTCAR